jgi:predicted AlkP superfamily pyrophosphatase or phosphodiesterase
MIEKLLINKHLLVLNVVGLSPVHLGDNTPNLLALANAGCNCHIQAQLPAVTSSVQATYLTGSTPKEHGIVANGWYMRELAEIRFWHQSNHLLQGGQIWSDLKQLDPKATSANIFWWYNMYCPADIAVTVRPMYPADGRKIPDIYTHPATLRPLLNKKFGQFPLFNFWGPYSNIQSSEWIANATKLIMENHKPHLTMAYLPHLDYALQKVGPNHPSIPSELQQIDAVCGNLIKVAKDLQIQVVVLSEYGIQEVDKPIHLNRLFRQKGWLAIREELGLELLDAGASKVFAVADHQVAHIYIQNAGLIEEVHRFIEELDGVDLILDEQGKKEYGLDNPRSGELIIIAKPRAWFTYYYWLEESKAPDFARTVDIHKKPGFDPVELFIDPSIKLRKIAILWRLLKKKLGFRTLMDVIPLDANLVKGSHGALPLSTDHGAVFICSQANTLTLEQKTEGLAVTQVKQTLLNLLHT